MEGSRRRVDPLALVPMIAAALVFWPVEGQFFHADDFYHLFRVRDQPWPAFLLQPHAGHVCITLSAMFALGYALFGLEPHGWFVALVLLHVANVALCFRVVELAGGGRMAAFVASLLWGLLPSHDQSLGWVTMAGQVVATTCILGVLGSLLATRDRAPGWPRLLAWLAALLVAATAHGAGMAAALAMPVAAWALRPPGAGRRRVVVVLASVWPVALLLVALSRTLAFAMPGMLAAVAPGLMPWKHVAAVVRLFTELSLVGIGSPFLGFAVPEPRVATAALVAIPWLLGVGLACRLADGPRRRAIMAFVGLGVAVYAATAVGRGGFYETLARVHGEPGTVPRYHYLPAMGLVGAACLAAGVLAARVRCPERLVAGACGAFAAALLLAWATSGWHPDRHLEDGRRFRHTRALIRSAAARATPDAAGIVRLPNAAARGVSGVVAHRLFPGWAAVFVLAEPDDTIGGRRVRFVEPSAAVRRWFAAWPRMHALIVPP